jgi:hypothetical protein
MIYQVERATTEPTASFRGSSPESLRPPAVARRSAASCTGSGHDCPRCRRFIPGTADELADHLAGRNVDHYDYAPEGMTADRLSMSRVGF